MGLTTRDRQPKPAFRGGAEDVRRGAVLPAAALSQGLRGGGQLQRRAHAQGLPGIAGRLNYPDYEVILVDDGSTDTTRQIAFAHPNVRYFRHEKNLGLSVARNTGIAAATGEIVAFTDSDCRADEDWLYYLVGNLLESEFAGIGGPNLLPPEDSPVAAAVMASPGGPAHVMLTDRQAEHIPGCNMAFYKVGAGGNRRVRPGLPPGGRRRGSLLAAAAGGPEDRVQPGGLCLALPALDRQAPTCGSSAATARPRRCWCASTRNISTPSAAASGAGASTPPRRFGDLLRPPVIYRGLFGSAGFQSLYAAEPALNLMLCTTLEYHVLVTLPLWVLSVTFHPLLPVAVTSLLMSWGCAPPLARRQLCPGQTALVVAPAGGAAVLPAADRPRLGPLPGPLAAAAGTAGSPANPRLPGPARQRQPLHEVQYWAEQRLDRLAFVAEILRRLDQQGWPNRADIGWSEYDVEITAAAGAAAAHHRGRGHPRANN